MNKIREIKIKIKSPFIVVESYEPVNGLRAFILTEEEINAIVKRFPNGINLKNETSN